MPSPDQEPTPYDEVFDRAVEAAHDVLHSYEPVRHEQVAEALRAASKIFADDEAKRKAIAAELTLLDTRPKAAEGLRDPQDWTAEEFTAVFGAPDSEDGETR